MLKGGLLHSDVVTTVSPSFARELLTPGGGFGLEDVFQSRLGAFVGILNGIDADLWNPAADPHIAAAYSAEDPGGKKVCKAALQTELGLPVEPRTPIVGWVGRLDPQKGVELLIESIPWLVAEGAQVVILGSAAAAHEHYEHQLRALERQFPHHVRSWIGFSEGVAHRIEAGADLFAMPSLFEPCGLNQLYSQRYGTPPVVRRTGGLTDSVWPASHDLQRGTGFAFERPSGRALRDALHRALHLYRSDPEAFDRIRLNGMRQDLSWDSRVDRWLQVYEQAMAVRH
jgi:starch synthase